MTKVIIILFAFLSVATAELASGLRLRWGAVENSSYFIDIPREVEGIIENGWTEATQPDASFFPTLILYCPTEPYVCALYDDAGYVAGLQIAIPRDAPDTADETMDLLGYFNWTHNNVDYHAMQQYFVSESYLGKSVSERQDSYDTTKTLQEDAVWYPFKNTGKLSVVNTDASGLEDTGYIENACLDTMGTHYYYNTGTNCTDNSPFFVLENNGTVIGTGWIHYFYGDLHDWFERIDRDFIITGLPYTDVECLLSRFDSAGGGTFMHIFYLDEPANIVCDSDDLIITG